MTKRTTALVGVIAGVLAGLLLGGVALVGASASTTSSGSSSATKASPERHRVRAIACVRYGDLPAKLRSDLAAAKKLKGEDRRKAMRAIVVKARKGSYGSLVQKVVKQRAAIRRAVVAKLPEQMRTDLKAVHKLPKDQRAAALKKIWTKAKDGGYGDQAKKVAAQLKAHHHACAAKHGKSGGKKGSTSGSNDNAAFLAA